MMTKQILGWMFALCEKLSYYDKPDFRKSAFEPFSNCCDKPSGQFLTSDDVKDIRTSFLEQLNR